MKFRYTEEVLNSSNWMDGNGEVHCPEEMSNEYLHSVLRYVYRSRDRYWLNCRQINVIENFANGDEFFHKVIRTSTLWKTIINQLKTEKIGFNFDWETGSQETCEY
ncbi:hypothetical protein IMAU10235_02934 [Lactiplantibacillus plantarum]|nr:hypothetical protein [Lactiplantibacillus plantarum]